MPPRAALTRAIRVPAAYAPGAAFPARRRRRAAAGPAAVKAPPAQVGSRATRTGGDGRRHWEGACGGDLGGGVRPPRGPRLEAARPRGGGDAARACRVGPAPRGGRTRG